MSANISSVDRLVDVMNRLLGPDGCPWDREQTHETLIRYLLEESYEVIEAIQEGDMVKLREELGDLLLQVVFHAALAEHQGYFSFADLAATVRDKMINRHPHVFGDLQLSTSNDVLENWEGFKQKEGKRNLLAGIPVILPALLRALKMQEKAARVGFDWPAVDGALDKLKEEITELEEARSQEEIHEEMGDMLFAMVNIARMKGIEPETALQDSNNKFARRFNYIEETVSRSGKSFLQFTLDELDTMWNEAKTKGL